MKLKGIDGGPHKRWSMWFNSMQREVVLCARSNLFSGKDEEYSLPEFVSLL
jgi:hypothetical protein